VEAHQTAAPPQSAPQGPPARWWLVPALAAVGCAAAVAVWFHWTVPVVPYDDAFITFRYVDNLLAGRGLVYNEGQRVFGASTPLYILWLSGLRLCAPGASIPELAVRLNAVPFVAAGFALFFLLRRLTRSNLLAACGAAGLLLNRKMLVISAGGMESYLFLTLLLTAVLALAADRAVLFGVLAGLSVLARPEGVLLAPVAVIRYWRPSPAEGGRWGPSRRGMRRLALSAAVGIVPVALWCAFAIWYYGTPVPHSIIAKSKPLYVLPTGFAITEMVTFVEDWIFAGHLKDLGSLRTVIAIDFVAAGAVGCLFLRRHRAKHAWIIPALLAGQAGIYWWGNAAVFQWYRPPMFAFIVVVLVAGLLAWGRFLRRWMAARYGLRRLAACAGVLVALAPVAWLALSGGMPYLRTSTEAFVAAEVELPWRLRVVSYREAADKLNGMAGPDTRVACSEIGSFGFHFRGRVLDGCALVSPEALPYLPAPGGAISPGFVEATAPDFVVTMPYFGHRLLATGWFERRYRSVLSVPNPGDDREDWRVVVYERVGGPGAAATAPTAAAAFASGAGG
jgi:hypothetical protein